jgi:membrane protein YqaA with SNARE-associated domain
MSSLNGILKPKVIRSKTISPQVRTLIFIAEIIFVTALFIIWFSSSSLRKNPHLWVLFLYSIPGNFLIDVIPYDPLVIYFGSLHDPLFVALVGVAGILACETINYTCFEYIVDLKFFDRILNNAFVIKLIDLFNKAPFWVMLIVAFTPVPIYPFRFLVVMARFPLFKYILALLIGRLPRLYLIALVGQIFNLPWYAYLILFIATTILMYFPLVKFLPKKRKKEAALDS